MSLTKLKEAQSVKPREMFIKLSAGIKPGEKAVSFLSRDVEAASAVGSSFTPADVVCGLLDAAEVACGLLNLAEMDLLPPPLALQGERLQGF